MSGAPRRIGYNVVARRWMYTEVVERPREHGYRVDAKGMGHRMYLPIAEMAGEEQDAPALLVRLSDPILSFRFACGEHLRR